MTRDGTWQLYFDRCFRITSLMALCTF